MSWSESRTHVLTAGLASIKVKAAGDIAYYDLKDLKDGKIVIMALGDKNSKQMPMNRYLDVNISAKMLRTDKATVLLSLATLATKDLDIIATAINGQTFSSENLAVPYVGCEWAFISSGDIESDRYVEFTFTRRFIQSQFDEFKNTAPDVGTADPGDALYLLNSIPRNSVHPSGFSAWNFRLNGAGSWTDDLGRFRKTVFEIRLKTTGDQHGRKNSIGQVNVSIKAEAMQTAATELALLAGGSALLINSELDHKHTLHDGTIFTFTNSLGLNFSYNNGSDSEDVAYIPMEVSGAIPVSSLSGLIS